MILARCIFAVPFVQTVLRTKEPSIVPCDIRINPKNPAALTTVTFYFLLCLRLASAKSRAKPARTYVFTLSHIGLGNIKNFSTLQTSFFKATLHTTTIFWTKLARSIFQLRRPSIKFNSALNANQINSISSGKKKTLTTTIFAISFVHFAALNKKWFLALLAQTFYFCHSFFGSIPPIATWIVSPPLVTSTLSWYAPWARKIKLSADWES